VNQIILYLFIAISLEAANGFYTEKLNDCNYLYSIYKIKYQYASSACLQLGKVDRTSAFIEEAQDEVDFLEFQKKTLGVACEQVQNGIPVSFKNNYCERIMNGSIIQQESKISTQANSDKVQQYDKQSSDVKVVDPAIQYKNSPQLQLNKLHIYGVNNFSYFRDRTDTIMVESSIGNFAIPKIELINSKRINFTSELSQKLDTLVQ